MNTQKLRIVVTGLIGQYPLGGIAWHYFQFVLGLAQLGHEVYYLEDTQQYPYNPEEGGLAKDCSFNTKFIANIMDRYGLAERWAYCFPFQNQWFGLSEIKRKEIIRSADILLNVSGTFARPGDYREIPKLVYIDTDPVFTQIKLARGQMDFKRLVDLHDRQFTFGESFSEQIPETGHHWIPTRQPVVLKEWENVIPPRDTYTTIMNWTSHNDVMFEGKAYGQKDKEFKRFLQFPKSAASINLEIAVNAGKTRRTPYDLLRYNGWQVVDPDDVCPDMDSYRNYIIGSKGEWSVAKNGYIQGQAGWFSDRSACYLAAGRPVILQETGFSKVLPVGEGLFAYRTVEEAKESLEKVESDYARHSGAARNIAENYFDSDKVLSRLIENCYAASVSSF